MMMSTFLRKMNCRSLSKTTSVSKSHHIRWASSSPLKVGILKETYDMWERRAPLAPQQVQEFLQTHSCQFLVQPCARRIFSSESYERAGATITDDLNECDIVLGVKRPLSMHGLPSHTTYGFFSHVQKGQPENMGLLQELLDQHDSLLDYECLVDQNGRRLVAFGKYAGMAGMVDTFSVLGQRLLQQYGEASPFLQCPPSRYHASLQDSQDSIRRISEQISTEGLSRPILVCMTGGPRGNVYSGVQEIFQMLPHEMVSVADLPEVAAQSGGNYYQVYGVAPTMADLYQRISGGSTMFDKTHFGEFPDQYLCSFANDIAPHCHVLMNGVYWNPEMPRLLTKQDMLELYESGKNRYVKVHYLIVVVVREENTGYNLCLKPACTFFPQINGHF